MNKNYLLVLLLFFITLFSITFEVNAKEDKISKIYKENIAKIENTMREIEEYVKINRMEGVYDKYPNFFNRSLRDSQSLTDYYCCEELFGLRGRAIIKFEMIECGKVDEKHKYIKCNIWTRYWTLGDDFFEKKGFADYKIYDKVYLLCNSTFSKVICAYDDLKTYEIVNDMKKLKNNKSVKAYYRGHNYIKTLNSDEVNLLFEFINNIKYNIVAYRNREDRVYFCGQRHDIKLELEYNNVKYEIWLEEGEEEKSRKAYFKDYDLFTQYSYDNKLFFKLFVDYYMMHNVRMTNFFYPDNFLGLGYPDYLFQSLPKESQEILCKSKMSYILYGNGNFSKPNYISKKWKNMNFKILKYKEEMANFYKNAEEHMKTRWMLRRDLQMLPYCPSNHNQKYEYKVETGSVELICPAHGKQTMRFE